VTRQPEDSEPSRRPPDYVIIVAASDWLQDRYPAAAASLPRPCTPARTATVTPNPGGRARGPG